MKTTRASILAAIIVILQLLALAGPLWSQSLVAYYPFNGDANDQSGNNHNGTVVGATLARDRFGNANSAYRFDGSKKNFISVPHHTQLSFGTKPFTIAAWVKFCGNQLDDYAGIVVKGPTTIFYPGYQLVICNGDKMSTQIGDETLYGIERRGVTPLSDNVWHFLTLVVVPKDNIVDLYVDGNKQTYSQIYTPNGPLNSSLNYDQPLYIGKERNSSIYFTGYIDDIRIYDYQLPPSEIDLIYHENGWTGGKADESGVNTAVSLCQGSSLALDAENAQSYLWSTGAQTFSISVGQSGIYWVSRTIPGGCKATDTFTVTTHPPPAVTPQSGEICPGSSVTIGQQASGGTPPYKYQWSPTTGLSSATVATPVASPTATTLYTVTVTDANGCTATSTATVTVKPAPRIQSTADLTICRGDSVTLRPNVSGGSGQYSYNWRADQSLSSTAVPTPVAHPTGTTTYYFTVDDGGGCIVGDSMRVVVHDPPKATAGGDITLCQGGGRMLTGGATGGRPPYGYNWSPNVGLSLPNVATPLASPPATTTYTLVVTDANGCRDSSRVTVTVGSSLNGFTQDLTLCSGSSVTIGQEASGGTPPYTYQWSPGIGLNSTTLATPVASPTITRRYTVTVTDAGGCTATGTVTVTVKAGPQIQSAGDQVICRGDSVRLRPNVSGGSGQYSYNWRADQSLSSTAVPTPVAHPTGTTTYYFTVDDGGGCIVSDSMRVVVHDPPRATAGGDITLCQGASGVLSGGVIGGTAPYRYSWSPSEGLSATDVATPRVTPGTTTSYRLVVTDANGCRDSSTMRATVVTASLEVGSVLEGEEMRLDTTMVGMERCDSVRVRNRGIDTVELNALSMWRNVEFSVPPSQAPMRIAPGEERWVRICYRPDETRDDRDTLMIGSDCSYRIAIGAQGLQQGMDRCGNALQIMRIDAEQFLRLGRPYPNPSSTEIRIPVEHVVAEEGSNIVCTLYDVKGLTVAQGSYQLLNRQSVGELHYETGRFSVNVESLPSGFYLAVVQSSEGILQVPIVVNR